ncbi:hypothetical protein [Streptomyces sp. H27-C3]|uniref:hypothetical protein n=1 Tax=Streptomyces sp. H27-C3 TaxID=3046305 RepID=UPI0024B9D8C2|nr:hypothetical protein [Streptomyces sp. H27-C3]MDJ0460630.1 hypothetical protein [Streptomyces sp. H27-C3]
MNARTLPHDPYTTAITNALTAAGLAPAEAWTSDGDTRGTYCYLNSVLTLDPSGTLADDSDDAPTDSAWPHGLLLLWEWHTGAEEDGDPERGPVWLFAELKADSSNEYPTSLPVHGYASPAAVVDAARKVVARQIGAGHFHNFGSPQWDGGLIGGSWDQADALNAACEAWGANETTE